MWRTINCRRRAGRHHSRVHDVKRIQRESRRLLFFFLLIATVAQLCDLIEHSDTAVMVTLYLWRLNVAVLASPRCRL